LPSRNPLRPLPETQAALDELTDFGDPDVAELLEDLGRRVSEIAPDAVGLSVGLVKDGLTFTLVSSDSRLAALDATQYLDGGPCVDAAETGSATTASTSDPLDEDRWHLFSQAGAVVGVASTLSLPIYRHGDVVGGLNIYGATQTAFDGLHEELASLLGARAVEAVTNADLSFTTRLDAVAAPRLLRERALVDTAVGLVAAQRGLSVEEAHDHLVRAAARAGVSETAVARVIVQIHTQSSGD
jgi:GAF domain-containing protein